MCTKWFWSAVVLQWRRALESDTQTNPVRPESNSTTAVFLSRYLRSYSAVDSLATAYTNATTLTKVIWDQVASPATLSAPRRVLNAACARCAASAADECNYSAAGTLYNHTNTAEPYTRYNLQWAVTSPPQICLFPYTMICTVIRCMVYLAHTSHNPKRHLDRLSYFYRARCQADRQTDRQTPAKTSVATGHI